VPNPLDWLGEAADGAYGWVKGQLEALWHRVVHFVYGVVHGITGWLIGLFGVVLWAWNHLVEAVTFVAEGIAEWASEVGSFLWTLVSHTIPHIFKSIAHAVKQAWHWVENAVKWAAKHIAHLAKQAWHWVENALKWVNNHVLRPLEHLAAYVWHHLTKWAHDAWYLVTHPLKLAELLFWPLWYVFEQVAWKVARKIGKWLAELVLHNLVRMVNVVEDIVAAVL
jgi:hypothetical protein